VYSTYIPLSVDLDEDSKHHAKTCTISRKIYSASNRHTIMVDVGPIIPFYIDKMTDLNFTTGKTIGVTYAHGFLSVITCVVLLILASLIIRARPKNAENRFMFVLLMMEAYRVMASWYNIYPFEGSEKFLTVMEYYRVGWYICSLTCIMMYVSTVSFYPIKRLEFMSKPQIKDNLWWALPAIASTIILLLVAQNGIVGTIGGAYYVECPDGSEGGDANMIIYEGSPEINGECIDDAGYTPYSWFIPGSSGIGKLLLILPVFSAIAAMLFMRSAWKRLEGDEEKEADAVEARSLFIGFAGKAIIKGTMVFSIVYMAIRFGDFNLADLMTVEQEYGQDVLRTYLYLMYGFLFSILLTGMLEGYMFSYAILKNEILGIDEKLRKTFSAAIFAGAGGISLLVASEIMEMFVGGGGLIGGVIVGVPLVVLRKPIFNVINNFSTVLMPEAFTSAEKSYIEAYEIAMEDRIITKEERKFLKLQAKTLGLDDERIAYIEEWYDANLEEE